ncbi:MAG: hypothetical protein JST89_16910 [Cyanobacteria bacterium SZAS-4]|nr:hypothetical protein [Cyanobacteria bacterium SZAS-4]
MTQDFESSQNKATAAKSCEQSLTRAEFITRIVKGAALTGGVLAAPRILDKFLVPPAFAGASTSTCTQGAATTAGGPDTVQDLGGGHFYVVCNNNIPPTASQCTNNGDTQLLANCL